MRHALPPNLKKKLYAIRKYIERGNAFRINFISHIDAIGMLLIAHARDCHLQIFHDHDKARSQIRKYICAGHKKYVEVKAKI